MAGVFNVIILLQSHKFGSYILYCCECRMGPQYADQVRLQAERAMQRQVPRSALNPSAAGLLPAPCKTVAPGLPAL